MPAVCSLGSELIYKSLEALVTKLVSHLVALGVRKTAIVPVLFEKSIWTLVVLVAILKTGLSFVLLDINQPKSRLTEILRQIDVTLLVTSVGQKERGIGLVGHNMSLTVSREAVESMPNTRMMSSEHRRAHDPLYVVFTSGLTGIPKGVIVTHSNYLPGALRRAEMIGYTESCPILASHPTTST